MADTNAIKQAQSN